MSSGLVYKLDGTLQCGMGSEVSVSDAKKELAALIGEKAILNGEKRRLPMMFPDVCGAPTGMANVFEVTEEGLFLLFHGFVGPAGFALWTWGRQAPTKDMTFSEDRPLPWPWSKFTMGDQEIGASIANAIASLNQVGANPTTLIELLGRRCRFYRAGKDSLTMDLVPQRVNFELDDHSNIQRIWFG